MRRFVEHLLRVVDHVAAILIAQVILIVVLILLSPMLLPHQTRPTREPNDPATKHISDIFGGFGN